MLPSPGSMKLSRVTNWRSSWWWFGVIAWGGIQGQVERHGRSRDAECGQGENRSRFHRRFSRSVPLRANGFFGTRRSRWNSQSSSTEHRVRQRERAALVTFMQVLLGNRFRLPDSNRGAVYFRSRSASGFVRLVLKFSGGGLSDGYREIKLR